MSIARGARWPHQKIRPRVWRHYNCSDRGPPRCRRNTELSASNDRSSAQSRPCPGPPGMSQRGRGRSDAERTAIVAFGEGFWTPARYGARPFPDGPASKSLPRRKPRAERALFRSGAIYGDLRIADGASSRGCGGWRQSWRRERRGRVRSVAAMGGPGAGAAVGGGLASSCGHRPPAPTRWRRGENGVARREGQRRS